jgi:chorismate mutase-like protein
LEGSIVKRPEPFYRPKRRRWYVQIDGKQINLGPDEKQAYQRYDLLMAARSLPRLTTSPGGHLTVVAVLDAYLDWLHNRVQSGEKAPRTFDWYKKYLNDFASFVTPDYRVRDLTVEQLQPIHVYQWVDCRAAPPSARGSQVQPRAARCPCLPHEATARWRRHRGLARDESLLGPGTIGPNWELRSAKQEAAEVLATLLADPKREQELLAKVEAQASTLGLDEGFVREFFRAQVVAGKFVQQADFDAWQRAGVGPPAGGSDLKALRLRIDGLNQQLLAALKDARPWLDREAGRKALLASADAVLQGEGITREVRHLACSPLLRL